jgi:hypothetical protein
MEPSRFITQPVVGLPARRGDGNFRIPLSGPAGYAYTLRTTTNLAKPLSQWDVLQTGTISSSPFTVNDLAATNFLIRFYRLSLP